MAMDVITTRKLNADLKFVLVTQMESMIKCAKLKNITVLGPTAYLSHKQLYYFKPQKNHFPGSSGAFKRYATPASYSLRIKTPSDVIIGSFIGCVLQCHKNPHCIMMSFTNSNPVRCTLSEWALLENQSDAHTGSQLYEVVERNRLLNVGFSKQLARSELKKLVVTILRVFLRTT